MIKGGVGGANTGTGLEFERKSDFVTLLTHLPGYTIEKVAKDTHDVLFNKKHVATTYKKNAFYKFLEKKRIDWKNIVSKKLLPDDAIIVIHRKTLHIIEVKFQQVAGSVDEKLQTCDFKRKQYQKLVKDLDLLVCYVYVLNSDWFDKPAYRDVLEYIESVNCNYCFDKLPLEWLGLPKPLPKK